MSSEITYSQSKMDNEREHLMMTSGDDKKTTANRQNLQLSRHVYTLDDYDRAYPAPARQEFSIVRTIKNKCTCTAADILKTILSYFPVIDFAKKYRIKESILGDFLAGLTVSFMHLPQAMALGILASLRPIHGLYTTFFSVLVYMIFGTSPQISFGTNAVMALLTATVIEREADIFTAARQAANESMPTDDEIMEIKLGTSMACCFLVGLILMCMGLLKFGVITTYLSVSFVGGFTTAVAFHVASSQVPKVFGINVQTFEGAGKLFRMYIDLFCNIAQTNAAEFIIAIVCMFTLLLVKICINEKFKDKMKIPVPIDLIVAIVGTIISHFANFKDVFGVKVAGEIPSGFNPPALPWLRNAGRFASDAFVMAILSLTMSISLAKLCANKHGVVIDDNQELFAYGASNFVSGFFHSFPSATAPPRTMILSTLGAKTTLNAIPTSVFILLVIMFIGQLFVSLPLSLMAAMIIISMKDLLLQYRNLPRIWRINKIDFVIWSVTNSVSILVDLNYGILAGVGISIFLIILRDQCASGKIVARASNEDILIHARGVEQTSSLRIFKVPTNLYFATAERIKAQIYKHITNPNKKITVNPNATDQSVNVKYGFVESKGQVDGKDNRSTINVNMESAACLKSDKIETVVIDLSSVHYIDMAGLGVLQQVTNVYKDMGINVCLAGVQIDVADTLKAGDFFKTFPKSAVYYDVFDALEANMTESKL
ncbi:sulfate transporter-like isoform X1 [Mya arenaria]|uniref:sulfate transporter-like isoform X1 n=2 Tax=Mya arenaria TaxID=6604 RepID=UPI0022E7D3C9|nr:sulfate transporter-like isoform X1 [Mya arenaria]